MAIIRKRFADCHLADDPLGRAGRDADHLAAIPTPLEEMDPALQNKLMNWGYAVCNAAVRAM